MWEQPPGRSLSARHQMNHRSGTPGSESGGSLLSSLGISTSMVEKDSCLSGCSGTLQGERAAISPQATFFLVLLNSDNSPEATHI